MSNFHQNISDFLSVARLLIENAIAKQEIRVAVEVFGYDDQRLQEGQNLLEEAEALVAKQAKEYSDQYEATAALNQAWEQADEVYTIHRKLAKLALRKEPEKQKKLLLHLRKKRNLSDWLHQATVFYKNVLEDGEIQADLQRFNITTEKLQEGATYVEGVADWDEKQEREKSEAQVSTKERDEALHALEEWVIEFREVAKIALQGNSQLLEALGLGAIS
jgi:hypothetical protein